MDQKALSLTNRIQKIALLAGAAGLIAALAGAFIGGEFFFQAYLLGYLFWVHLALGCLMGVMLHHLVGGKWSFVIRRFFEAGAGTLPLLALLFIPLLFGLPALYPWTHANEVAHSALLQHKAGYLNVPFFIGRAALYFIIWFGLAYLLNRWSRRQDDTGDPGLKKRMVNLSPPGLILLVLTATFAAFDWMMSLEPEWFSSIYGVLFISGQALAAIAFALIMLKLFEQYRPLADWASVGVYNDLGNFLLAFVSFWAYIAFSQYLIIWSGNLPEEITWYITRTQGGWQYVGLALIIFHFVLPFAVLLARSVKRRAQVLAMIAGFIGFMRLVDLFWLTMPALRPTLTIHWLDLVIPLAMGGLWVAFFARQLKRKALLPRHDPRFQEIPATHAEVAVHE
ncbi:MAG: hypothetical protein JW953_00300 [Anaerolineae bacterium]|nr:hypothetical protein [Anaerolineae bacterium]